MIDTETLKTFVKMHEYKLDAKINARRANRLHNRLERTTGKNLFGVADEHYKSSVRYEAGQRQPKSDYLNFIVTGR